MFNWTIASLIVRRLGAGLLTLFLVAALIFGITSLLPGDAAQLALGQQATPETVAALRQQLGLDQPVWLRFWQWLAGILQGDLGTSYASGFPVAELIASRIPNSLMLAGVTVLVSVPIALVLGIVSAMSNGSRLDRVLGILTMSVVAVPEFLVATLAVLVFAVKLQWLPALSFGGNVDSLGAFFRSYAMPVLTLCCVVVAQMARMTRAAIINQLDAPYVEMALLKGGRPLRVVLSHALPNAVGPIANVMALSTSYLLGGVIIIETIFNYPGLALQLVDAVSNRDLPMVQAGVLFFSACYLFLLLLADICTIVFNPRLRKS